ncbi:hypothetical protein [Luteimonas salinilitoris]|uniref:Uncharacterized protein n=1 Tax=Luteimonas salinilitoris TaxID=3237697 RepID=A0ABV4HQN6_9GAMM
MTEDFAPVPPRPKNWEDVFTVTKELRGVPIEEIERGRVDWEYHFDAKDMRPCGRKGCEQKHAHGWLVALPGLRFVHIGNDCALKYANAGLWSSNVSIYRERVRAEARTAALIEARDKAQRKQFWLDNTQEIDPAVALHESFVRQARGPFLDEIEKRAERGQATVERDRRLSEDELQMRRAMLSGSRVEGEPGPYVAAVENVTVGNIEGLDCFRPQGSPRELQSQLQRLVTTLLTWSPAEDDQVAQRSLVRATDELAPLSNRLNSSLVAVNRFFSESNLKTLMLLDVTRSQGVTSIELDGSAGVIIKRLPHWQRAA